VSAGLAIQGLLSGSAHSIPAFPQWDLLGPTRSQQLQALTAVMPVLIACYNAAQSLHPLMPLVQPYSEQRMRRVIALALAVSFGIYWTLSVGSVMAFGTNVEVGVREGSGTAIALLHSANIDGILESQVTATAYLNAILNQGAARSVMPLQPDRPAVLVVLVVAFGSNTRCLYSTHGGTHVGSTSCTNINDLCYNFKQHLVCRLNHTSSGPVDLYVLLLLLLLLLRAGECAEQPVRVRP
jgi:hypothetical protein